jgi:hypothetical protein
MPAVEYGSYYWCVVLDRKNDAPSEYIHLHSDEVAIEPNGSLTFRSAGRRPAGTEPRKTDAKQEAKDSNNEEKKSKVDEPTEGAEKGDKQPAMIYVCFAPGTWRAVYAAKLQDGSPVSIEHWNAAHENSGAPAGVYPNAGAAARPARE